MQITSTKDLMGKSNEKHLLWKLLKCLITHPQIDFRQDYFYSSLQENKEDQY